MTGAPAPGPGPLSTAAERIRQMLVTAESVAEDIRREAVEEAERYLAERRRETDALVAARTKQLEHALEVLRSARPEIERRLADVTGALEQALEEAPREPAPAQPVPAPPAIPAPDTEAAAETDGHDAPAEATSHVRQRALIRATQLAVQGAERETVKDTLEREFELDDATAIVDEILGR
jgi:hypothetical protein